MQVPIPEVFTPLYEHNRYKIYYGGRGGAKSWNFAIALLCMGRERKLRVLCAREVQKSIRESVHKLLAEQIERLGLSNFYTVRERGITGLNGTEFFFEGLLRNIASIKSIEGVDIVWVEEAQTVSEESWKYLIPTIRKPGSEVWISFNPRYKVDPTYQRYVLHPPEGALCKKVSWRDNPWFTDELEMERQHLKALDYDEYMHVWEGELKEFADGAVYGQELRKARREGRICHVPYVPGIPVNTMWDLGRNDTTAIWFHQRVGFDNRFIGCYEHNFVGLDHYSDYLRSYAREVVGKDGNVEGFYGEHFLPHDVEVTELTSNRNRREILEEQGTKPIVVVPRVHSVNEGIDQTRQKFHSCYFDEKGCEEGLEALSNYQYSYDEQNATYRMAPLHNWASNYADAFRQFGQGYSTTSGWGAAMRKEGLASDGVTPLSERRKKKIKGRFTQDTAWRV